MRPLGNDRSRFPSNPPENTRKIERLRDEDSVLETNVVATGTVEFEVTGAIPEFTGVPAGLQQFYSAPIVVDNAINMTNTFQLPPIGSSGAGSYANLPLSQDTGNTFGEGTASIIGTRNTSSACLYNFASTTAASFPFDSFSSSPVFVRVADNFTVVHTIVSRDTRIIQDGVSTSIVPAMLGIVRGAGSDATGTYVCYITYNSFNATTYFYVCDLDGTVVNYYALASGDIAAYAVIDNGWVVMATTSGSVRCFEAVNSTPVMKTFTGLYSSVGTSYIASIICNNVYVDSATGNAYTFVANVAADDAYRINLTTGLVSAYPEVFARYIDSATKTHDIVPYCMHIISDEKFVFGGYYQPLVLPEAGTFYPIYCAVVIGGGAANVTDSIFTEYATNSGGSAYLYAITSTANGDVVYAVLTPSPYDDFLVKVTGP